MVIISNLGTKVKIIGLLDVYRLNRMGEVIRRAGPPGFEPGITLLERVVMPFHYGPKSDLQLSGKERLVVD